MDSPPHPKNIGETQVYRAWLNLLSKIEWVVRVVRLEIEAGQKGADVLVGQIQNDLAGVGLDIPQREGP